VNRRASDKLRGMYHKVAEETDQLNIVLSDSTKILIIEFLYNK